MYHINYTDQHSLQIAATKHFKYNVLVVDNDERDDNKFDMRDTNKFGIRVLKYYLDKTLDMVCESGDFDYFVPDSIIKIEGDRYTPPSYDLRDDAEMIQFYKIYTNKENYFHIGTIHPVLYNTHIDFYMFNDEDYFLKILKSYGSGIDNLYDDNIAFTPRTLLTKILKIDHLTDLDTFRDLFY